ncbi:MAG: DNRLRE domain-containing protein, partial [Firmicutes bacterium]|nr:DNRLRE domain-containing protein [Bacillota bacterium]
TLKGATISSATLNCYENGDGIANQVVRVYKLLTDWDYTDITWNTVPNHGTASSYLDAITSSGVANRKQSFDITDWVQDVVMDEVSNYGIAIKNQIEASESYAEFYGTRSTSTAYRPYLSITYTPDEPTVPDVTSVSGSYIHTKGSNVTLSWSGLTCNFLDHVEYKIVEADSSWTAGDTLVAYTDLVTTNESSGSATIPGMSSYDIGYYNVHIRGVSEMGEPGTGRIYGVRIVQDRPATPLVTAASNTYPVGSDVVVNWTGLTGNNLTKAQYRIELSNENWEQVEYGFVPYTTFTTSPTSSGSLIIPDSDLLEPGYYKIYIRGVNSSGVHGVGYGCRVQILEDAAPEVGTITFKKGTNTLDDYEYVSPGDITVTVSDMYDEQTITGSNLWYLLSPPGDSYTADYLTGHTVTKASDGTYTVSFTIPASEVQETGTYGLYFKVIDAAGNSDYDIQLFWIDSTAPTGSLSTSLVSTAENSDVLEGMALLTVNVADAHSGVGNSAVTLYKGTKDNVGEQVAVLASDSSLQKIVALDSTAYEDGNYTMKLVVTDNVGNTATFWKDISIDNRMTKPTVGVSVAEGNTALNVQWGYQSEMAELDYLQYNLDNAETWTNVAITNKTNGSFAVPLPAGAVGTHSLLVRGMDTSGEYGETARTDFNIDTTSPVVDITDISRGIVTGTVTDDYLASWSISVKERDNTEAVYTEIAAGTKAVTAGRIGIADLSDSQYAADTWYTVKVEATDEVGNKSSDTFDVYKDATYQVATLVTSENRILRSLGQDQQLSNFIVSSTEDALEMKNGSLFASALWMVNDAVASTVLNFTTNFSAYVDGVLNQIAAVGKDASGNVFYSNDVYLNAAEDTYTFGTASENQIEQTITLTQDAVAFKLNAPASVTT